MLSYPEAAKTKIKAALRKSIKTNDYGSPSRDEGSEARWSLWSNRRWPLLGSLWCEVAMVLKFQSFPARVQVVGVGKKIFSGQCLSGEGFRVREIVNTTHDLDPGNDRVRAFPWNRSNCKIRSRRR